MKSQVFRVATVHINTCLQGFVRKRLYNLNEEAVLFIFKSSFFTNLSHALDYSEWEVRISYASD